MRKNGTGGIQHNLKSGGNNAPPVTSGNGYTFQLNDLPDRAPTGPLALYLTCLLMTLAGTLTQAGGTGSAIPRDRMPSLLIDSVDWTNSWMGPVAPKATFSGSRLPIIEYVAGGFQNGQRQQNPIPAATGAYPFSMTTRLPALNDRRGRLVKETSQLAVLFQPSQIKVTLQPLATLTAFSTGATLSGMTMTITAQLDPRQELVLGTPMEWFLHTPVSGGPQVTIQGFGRENAVTGTKVKGGVAFLMDLADNVNGLGGCVRANLITDFQFQWRGQGTTYDIKAYIQQFLDLLPNDRAQVSGNVSYATLAEINDFGGFPYPQNASGGSSAGSATVDVDGLLGFILAMGGDDLELTDLQTAISDQTYNLTQSTAFSSLGANHLILAEYAREWEPEKRADWISQIVRGGESSLAACVLEGAGNVAAAVRQAAAMPEGLARRLPKSKHVTTGDQKTYLAWQLAPAA